MLWRSPPSCFPGPLAWLMPLSVAISTFGSANGTIFAAGRLCYVASREGHLVDVLSFVHIKKLTPAPALLFHAMVALAMVLSGDIEGLIDFFRYRGTKKTCDLKWWTNWRLYLLLQRIMLQFSIIIFMHMSVLLLSVSKIFKEKLYPFENKKTIKLVWEFYRLK